MDSNPRTLRTPLTSFSNSVRDWTADNCCCFCCFFWKTIEKSRFHVIPLTETALKTCWTRFWLHTLNMFKPLFMNLKASWREAFNICGVDKSSDIFVWKSVCSLLMQSLAAGVMQTFCPFTSWNGDKVSSQSRNV